jgi:hypothetical protein
MQIIKRIWFEGGELRQEEIAPEDFYILPTRWQRFKKWLRDILR